MTKHHKSSTIVERTSSWCCFQNSSGVVFLRGSTTVRPLRLQTPQSVDSFVVQIPLPVAYWVANSTKKPPRRTTAKRENSTHVVATDTTE